jgi:hypothetical protein
MVRPGRNAISGGAIDLADSYTRTALPRDRSLHTPHAAVADLSCHRADRPVRLEQQVCRQREPPSGEERHRWLANQIGEPAGEGRTRHADLLGQRCHRGYAGLLCSIRGALPTTGSTCALWLRQQAAVGGTVFASSS